LDIYLLKFPYRKILIPIAKKLHWLNPDIVSYSAVVVAAGTGWCFYKATDSRFLLIIAIILTFLRMTLNTIDGVMAIQRGKHSLEGEIVNALPDRYSDIFVVGGIVLSPLCRDWLGLSALATMFLVSYSGVLGKAISVSWQHQGPMGKVERMIIIMTFSFFQFFLLPNHQGITIASITITPMEMAMGLFVFLGQYTILRRLRGQLNEIRQKENELQPDAKIMQAIVVYDTMTGNTRRVAAEIARGIGCTAISVTEVGDISTYTLVVIGTPNIRKRPTSVMQKFLESVTTHPPLIAIFVTFGLPLWGQITAPMCIRYIAKKWSAKPIAHFSCPGYHRKYKTYKGHPGNQDMRKAYSFGTRLARKLNQQLTEQVK
jgi:phosphatidylglycerophosphate synthase/flavodoxin